MGGTGGGTRARDGTAAGRADDPDARGGIAGCTAGRLMAEVEAVEAEAGVRAPGDRHERHRTAAPGGARRLRRGTWRDVG
ncbi:hypothetical protein Afil01_17290 [Actinorhabdospora filicis]|uniref:Uncharacterized protein n=1 Tax=Actinorhabdospora filicis TaxID=1785913 RepID=A0A9W6SJG5_9ACTN|nr:hypothetical protein Afil01_17290 [Actinorhabdospora filicis]